MIRLTGKVAIITGASRGIGAATAVKFAQAGIQGMVISYNRDRNAAEQVAAEVRTHFGDKVCRMVIPRTVRLSEAPSFGQPILTFDPTSRGAVAYRELAKEVSGGMK